MRKNYKLEERIKSQSNALGQAGDEIAALQAVKTDMQQVITSLNESLISHAQNEGLLAEKLMTIKSELQEVNSELRIDVLKINKLINRETKLFFHRNEAGVYVFEVDQKVRKKVFTVSSILDVAADRINPRRFTVRLEVRPIQNEDLKVFESCDAVKLVPMIKRFLDRVSPK
jgi:hypothetical protein